VIGWYYTLNSEHDNWYKPVTVKTVFFTDIYLLCEFKSMYVTHKCMLVVNHCMKTVYELQTTQ